MALLSLGKPRAVGNIPLSALVNVGDLSALWLNSKKQLVNDQKHYTTEYYMKRWDKTDFTRLTLPLATETWNSLTF